MPAETKSDFRFVPIALLMLNVGCLILFYVMRESSKVEPVFFRLILPFIYSTVCLGSFLMLYPKTRLAILTLGGGDCH